MEEKILNILTELRPECDFINSNNYIEEGLLDSMDIVYLVETLEETFDISIPGTDIAPINFSSLSGIVKLVEKAKS